MTQPPPSARTGWYEDPEQPGLARYWNGSSWEGKPRKDVKGRPIPTVAEQTAADEELQRARIASELWRSVILTTSHEVPGKRLERHCGEVFGITVQSRNAISDLGASLRNAVGGEAVGYTKMLTTARHQALERLRKEAHDVGANAVVAMRMSTTEVQGGMTEVVAYGAAVVAEDLG